MRNPEAVSMNNVYIQVSGCDDSTNFHIDLTDDELATVHRLAAASEHVSDSGCEPIIEVFATAADFAADRLLEKDRRLAADRAPTVERAVQPAENHQPI